MNVKIKVVIFAGKYIKSIRKAVSQMNKVEINIIELGPVKDCKIQLAPLMLFTGASSLGKSYVNFLCYYIFSVFASGRLDEFIRRKITLDLEKSKSFSFVIKQSELRLFLEKDVKDFFKYLLNYNDINCQVQFVFHDEHEKYEFEYKEVDKTENGNTSDIEYGNLSCNGEKVENILVVEGLKSIFLMASVRRTLQGYLLGKDVPSEAVLLPPGRASLLTGDFSTQVKSSRIGLYDMFLRDNDRINRRMLRMQRRESNDFFVKQIYNLIGGDIQVDREGLHFITGDGTSIPIDAAASSIKELSPLLMLIKGGGFTNYSVCIEEPEAHLHPTMQVTVADLLAACINKGYFMQITTHSDYFVQRVNQLIKLGRLRKSDESAYNAFCKREGLNTRYYVDSNNLQAYFFSRRDDTTEVYPLVVEGEGVPMSTFVSAVEKLSHQDEIIDNEINKV